MMDNWDKSKKITEEEINSLLNEEVSIDNNIIKQRKREIKENKIDKLGGNIGEQSYEYFYNASTNQKHMMIYSKHYLNDAMSIYTDDYVI